MSIAVKLVGVTKKFGSVVANKNINLEINRGEILSLLGENGSGKTTLMNIISGIYYPDEGEIFVNGAKVKISSPKDAITLGIGMIHQHFKLIDVFTALDNIILGLDEGFLIDRKKATEKINNLMKKYGFELDINKKIYDMSVSEKQTVEILKVLYRGADTLILDEPTAVLTPQETDRLFQVLKNMKMDNKAIVIITHKLNEVLELSDKVSILRKGEFIGTVNTNEANEELLTEMMVGKKVELNINREDPVNPIKRIEIKNLNAVNEYGVKVLDDINFDIYGGEILGIAGIAGSGQKELLEAISGLYPVANDSKITYTDKFNNIHELVGMTPKRIKELGVGLAFVPEDRLGMGLVGSMNMTENMLIRSYEDGKAGLLNTKAPSKLALRIKEQLEVVTPSIKTPVKNLSGGNVQKVLVGREISMNPTVLMTAYAVRGLDINTSYAIYNILCDEKRQGAAVVYVGEDLDVILALCDRIVVMCGGRISGIVDARTTTKQEVGRLMATVTKFDSGEETFND